MKKYFVVRSRKDNDKFASESGWTTFDRATIFTFKDNAPNLIETFRSGLDRELLEMVEISFTPVLGKTLN